MSASTSTIINTLRAEIVKYGNPETLKKFYSLYPKIGILPSSAFTRHRIMSLSDMLFFLLSPRSKSTEIELLEHFHLIGKPNVNKSDFSKRRRLIPAEYLHALHQEIVSDIYSSEVPVTWNGHLLLAADGTTYSLPDTPVLRAEYLHGRKTGTGQQPLARGVVLKDIINDIVIDSTMECYGKDEIKIAIEELDHIPGIVRKYNPLVIFDRKYCAYSLIAKLVQDKIDFIIRVKERFNKQIDDFIHSTDKVRDVILNPAPTTLKKLSRLYGGKDYSSFKVRLVRMSETVVVMTSVTDVPVDEEPHDLYHKRWDDETTIGFFKNNLQVEIFSGISDTAIRQDFISKVITYNLIAVLIRQAAMLRHDNKPRQINRNIALGIFKLNFMAVMGAPSSEINFRLELMLKEMTRFSTPVIPGRHNHRAFRKIKHSGKYITLTNYQRAI